MSEPLLENALSEYDWVEWPADWAALYYKGRRVWEGHPGDFEWAYHLGMSQPDADSIALEGPRLRAPEYLP